MTSTNHEKLVIKATEYVEQPLQTVMEDTHRLAYHIMTPRGWMNDPNGLIHFNGEYHVFYQHYPYDSKWGPMHWGHAISSDLVHWKHAPIALAPSELYDTGGCFSGSAVNDNGTLTLIYTGHEDQNSPKEVQCIARSQDGVHFTKYENNPVIDSPPTEGSEDFRDPKVWKHEDKWFMVVGTGKDGVGKALLYQSSDLLNWEYKGVVAESDGTLGYMWECPDLFKLQNKHVLVLSPMKDGWQNRYVVGELNYETGKFSKDADYQLDYGFHFYAPQTFEDEAGRRILIGWMDMWETTMPTQKNGWAGAMTIPRELTLSQEGRLLVRPVSELEMLRTTQFEITKASINPLSEIQSQTFEMKLEVEITNDDASFEIGLCVSKDHKEETVITYDRNEVSVNLQKSGQGLKGISRAPVSLIDNTLHLHIYVDSSSIELFINHGENVITNRIYPSSASKGAYLKLQSPSVEIRSIEAWQLKKIWE